MVVIEALVRLYQTTRNNDYRQVCEATLSAFVETFREQGEFAAEYGLATLWGPVRLMRTAPISREMILNYVAQHSLNLPRSY